MSLVDVCADDDRTRIDRTMSLSNGIADKLFYAAELTTIVESQELIPADQSPDAPTTPLYTPDATWRHMATNLKKGLNRLSVGVNDDGVMKIKSAYFWLFSEIVRRERAGYPLYPAEECLAQFQESVGGLEAELKINPYGFLEFLDNNIRAECCKLEDYFTESQIATYKEGSYILCAPSEISRESSLLNHSFCYRNTTDWLLPNASLNSGELNNWRAANDLTEVFMACALESFAPDGQIDLLPSFVKLISRTTGASTAAFDLAADGSNVNIEGQLYVDGHELALRKMDITGATLPLATIFALPYKNARHNTRLKHTLDLVSSAGGVLASFHSTRFNKHGALNICYAWDYSDETYELLALDKANICVPFTAPPVIAQHELCKYELASVSDCYKNIQYLRFNRTEGDCYETYYDEPMECISVEPTPQLTGINFQPSVSRVINTQRQPIDQTLYDNHSTLTKYSHRVSRCEKDPSMMLHLTGTVNENSLPTTKGRWVEVFYTAEDTEWIRPLVPTMLCEYAETTECPFVRRTVCENEQLVVLYESASCGEVREVLGTSAECPGAETVDCSGNQIVDVTVDGTTLTFSASISSSLGWMSQTCPPVEVAGATPTATFECVPEENLTDWHESWDEHLALVRAQWYTCTSEGVSSRFLLPQYLFSAAKPIKTLPRCIRVDPPADSPLPVAPTVNSLVITPGELGGLVAQTHYEGKPITLNDFVLPARFHKFDVYEGYADAAAAAEGCKSTVVTYTDPLREFYTNPICLQKEQNLVWANVTSSFALVEIVVLLRNEITHPNLIIEYTNVSCTEVFQTLIEFHDKYTDGTESNPYYTQLNQANCDLYFPPTEETCLSAFPPTSGLCWERNLCGINECRNHFPTTISECWANGLVTKEACFLHYPFTADDCWDGGFITQAACWSQYPFSKEKCSQEYPPTLDDCQTRFPGQIENGCSQDWCQNAFSPTLEYCSPLIEDNCGTLCPLNEVDCDETFPWSQEKCYENFPLNALECQPICSTNCMNFCPITKFECDHKYPNTFEDCQSFFTESNCIANCSNINFAPIEMTLSPDICRDIAWDCYDQFPDEDMCSKQQCRDKCLIPSPPLRPMNRDGVSESDCLFATNHCKTIHPELNICDEHTCTRLHPSLEVCDGAIWKPLAIAFGIMTAVACLLLAFSCAGSWGYRSGVIQTAQHLRSDSSLGRDFNVRSSLSASTQVLEPVRSPGRTASLEQIVPQSRTSMSAAESVETAPPISQVQTLTNSQEHPSRRSASVDSSVYEPGESADSQSATNSFDL